MMAKQSSAVRPASHFDILIIGGGINGAGIAREAAARGYSVCLCDKGDFAGGTSSASTKLIHGGLRYLEHYEFRLVREALQEREVLWKMAPHIIRPMRFVLPYHKGLRPAWLLRLGLFLYDNLGGRKLLPGTKTLDLEKDEAGAPLKSEFKKAFEYSDCWVEDSRLVVLNLRDAQNSGAEILPRTEVINSKYVENEWQTELKETNGSTKKISSSLIINAAGPWVDEVLRQVFKVNDANNLRLVRGSHIIIPRKFQHDRSYIFQNLDERILFAIPYENEYTLIGTTDAEQENIHEKPQISKTEIDYLCSMASEYFEEPVTPEEIVWTYAGVRSLYNDGATKAQEATRDYVIRPEESIGDGRLINIFGGKITTFRMLAKSAAKEIETIISPSNAPTMLPAHFTGGDFDTGDFDTILKRYKTAFPFLDKALLIRLTRTYGTEVPKILENVTSVKKLGRHFGQGLYATEVKYLIQNEWARRAEDIVFRRTKLGIRMNKGELDVIDAWIKDFLAKQ